MSGITSRQLKALWALSHRAGLDDAALHALVASRTGRASVRELLQREAGALIEELAAAVEGRPVVVTRPGAATRAQEAMLARLADEMRWPPERLPALARRMYGARAIGELTVKQASGLIEALKAMATRAA
ncbi:MAG: phage protein GemA/Gp16 family protein [Nitrospirota bacterium]